MRMNMVEFYRKMDGLLNPSTTSKKVVDESAITVIQPSSSSSSTYTPVRPNADSAAVSYANRNADTEYEEYVYVEITDDENRVYQGAESYRDQDKGLRHPDYRFVPHCRFERLEHRLSQHSAYSGPHCQPGSDAQVELRCL